MALPNAPAPAATNTQPMQTCVSLPGNAAYGDYRKSLALVPGTTTLNVTRGGTAGYVKMQGPDGIVESINGTQGDQSFTVQQLPDRATLDLGGNTLLGINCLRYRLLTMRYFIQSINYNTTTTAQLNNGPVIKYGNIDGSTGFDVYATAQDVSNMQQVTTLLTLTKPVELNSNNLIQLYSLASEVISLVITWKSRGNYAF